MNQPSPAADTTVSAGDIARLVDVGRAAVSNWRRRHEDFPQPVGGTASSPLFSLAEVQDWLRRNGKRFELSLADRTWQHLRAATDDLRLGHQVAAAGALLVALRDHEIPTVPGGREVASRAAAADPVLVQLLTELAAERGHRDAFEFLCARYLDAHSRQLSTTPPELAGLLVQLANPGHGRVLDPACGLGGLLVTAQPTTALAQDSNDTSAAITAARLRLHDIDATVVTGDSLRVDGFADAQADAVVCEPPWNERAWGHDELTGDPRWSYGLPPRGEPELAWVQHCLAHVRPGGLVAILLPPAAASRRAGRRIRGNLLRAGALQAVFGLGVSGPDLWLLRRPVPGDRPPTHLLIMDAADALDEVVPAWTAFRDHPDTGTPIIDLLDDTVDIGIPANRPPWTDRDLAAEFRDVADALKKLSPAIPDLSVLDDRRALPMTTIGELTRAGLLTIRADPGIDLRAGDVVATRIGEARVVTADGDPLPAQLTRYRPDPDRLDADFLAGMLRLGVSRSAGGSSRVDARRVAVPLLPLAEQRAYGRAFAQLIELAETARATAELAQRLLGLGFAGLMDGHLHPEPTPSGHRPAAAAGRRRR